MERSSRELPKPIPASPIKTNGEAEQLRIGIVVDENNYVCLHFGKPVAWVGMPPQMAASLGAELIRHAVNTAEKMGMPLEVKPDERAQDPAPQTGPDDRRGTGEASE